LFCPKIRPEVRKTSFQRHLLIKLPAIGVAAGIWLLSSQSILPQPKGILGFDKFQHLIAYLVFAGTLAPWFPLEWYRAHPLKTALWAAGIASAYGIIDEVHQYFVPGRDCNLWDWIADTLGAAIGAALLFFAARRILVKRHQSK
jgi:VanZ family protein